MTYQHEVKERKQKPLTINTEAPPAPLKEQWALDMMREYLEGRGLSYERALENGCFTISRKGKRLYIPARSLIQGHVYWQARTIEQHCVRWDSPAVPRRDALIVMYGPLKDKAGLDRLVIVEGPMDALAVASLDLHIGIALMGISPSQEALDHVFHYVRCFNPRDIVCVADKDQIGGMCKVQGYLAMRQVASRLVVPLAHKDIACYSVEERKVLLDT